MSSPLPALRTRLAKEGEDMRSRCRQVQLLFLASPWRASVIGLLILLTTVAGAGMLIGLGLVVDGVASLATDGSGTTGSEGTSLWTGILLLAACLLAGPLIDAANAVLTVSLDQRARAQRHDRLARVLLKPDGIAHLDSGPLASRAGDLVEEARTWQILGGTGNTVTVISTRVAAIAPLVIVASWNMWAALLLLVMALMVSVVWSNYFAGLLDLVMFGTTGQSQRRQRYMFQIAGGASAAKEVRLFGLLPWIRPRLAGYERGQDLFTDHVPGTPRANGAAALQGIALLVVIVLAAHDALAGTLAVGRLATVLAAGIAVLDGFGMLGDVQAFFLKVGRFERRVDALALDLEEDAEKADATAPAATPSAAHPVGPPAAHPTRTAAAISIRDLAFRYPGRRADTLHSLDLTIPAGQSVGVVGANGAGKSTLMSLIAGLETPTVGAVMVGGTAAAAPVEGHPRVAVILQEFTRYPLDVRDNIVLGRPTTDATIRARLDRDHAGLDTMLSPGSSGGTDFSGGQWQRLAIARALSAVDAGAQVLVLDEPTSALDVRTEAALFDDFLAVTQGVTTLLVSHRLSSVRRTDRIIVVDEGRIIEDGSHQELLAAGGHYAAMFTLQAERFAQAGEADD
jgi:ATP-binding cassette subfamily B protein